MNALRNSPHNSKSNSRAVAPSFARTPAGLARNLSDGRWQLPPHLALLNRKLLALAARRIRRMMIFMPPRHGKSQFASRYFPAWYLCNFPTEKVILASYEATFAASWGRQVRDCIAEANGRGYFPVRVAPGDGAASSFGLEQWDGRRWRNSEGGMVTAGAGGAITGRGGNLLICDDPIKNAEEAASATYREKLWDWYNSTFATRAEPDAIQLVILTRWNRDDLAGRILDTAEEPWEVLSLPALAEEDDALGRAPGEALWPERYPVAALDQIRRERGSYWWASMYQQRPAPREGGYFKRAWLENIVEAAPLQPAATVRYWDRGATEGGGDYTVGVRMSRDTDGTFYVEDVRRGQWSTGTVRRTMLATAQADGQAVPVGTEQEPGSSGVDVKRELASLFAGFDFRCRPVTGSKEQRAQPFAAACENGLVRLVRGDWNTAFIEELCSFNPELTKDHDDQVDAASGAFQTLTKRGGVRAVYE